MNNLHTKIAKNRNYTITGRVVVLPLTGKYCMEKRGVAASELSTVRKKPEYHADFVIWGFGTLCFYKGAKEKTQNEMKNIRFGTLCFYKGAKAVSFVDSQRTCFGTLCFYKGAKVRRVILIMKGVLEPYVFTENIKILRKIICQR